MQSLQLVKFLKPSENSNNLKITWNALFVSTFVSIAIPLNVETGRLCDLLSRLRRDDCPGGFARAPQDPVHNKS